MKIKRIFALSACLVFYCLLNVASASAATYYVDAAGGNDLNDGKADTRAWKSVGLVSRKTFSPGDIIQFKSGQTFDAANLYPNSGNNLANVTYTSYGDGAKPVLYSGYVSGKSYVTFKNLRFYVNSSTTTFTITESHHITVENCDIIAGPNNSTSSVFLMTKNVSNSIIRGTFIEHQNLNVQTDGLNIKRNSNYNLIENNRIGKATHYALTLEGSNWEFATYTCSFNIIRNNIIDNPEGAIFEIMSNSNNNVIEGNVFSGGKSRSFNVNLPRSFKSVSKNNIIRNNVIKNNTASTGSGMTMEVYQYTNPGGQLDPPNIATGNRIYNNIITGISTNPFVIATNSDPGAAVYDNIFKNNIIYNNGSGNELVVQDHVSVHDNFFFNNIFYKSTLGQILKFKNIIYDVATVQRLYSQYFTGNKQEDPKLGADFHPVIGSPAVDAGSYLAKVMKSDQLNSSITLDDAKYFSAGYGITSGDYIQIGADKTNITSIDYSSNTIKISPFINAAVGTKVSLPYKGSAPDMGAFENENVDLNAPAVPTGLIVN